MDEGMTTKERIIYESLKLFSVNGYTAVSTRMISHAVEMSDTALYKHFRNKQEILDIIITQCQERYIKQMKKVSLENMDWDHVEDLCLSMFHFQTTDEWIVMFRRLLLIEQFKNQEFAELYQRFFIHIPVDGQTKIFETLMEQGYVKKGNPRVLAMELYAPFFLYHTIANCEDEALQQELREHVQNFRKEYRIQ